MISAPIVLDTNIVLDIFVFNDVAVQALRAELEAGARTWIATEAMRVELARVLGYPKIVPRLVFYEISAGDVIAAFDRLAHIVPAAAKAVMTCKDPDDQIFIDLAVAHGAMLLSKDGAVRALRKRLAALGVEMEP
ncbi:putative PIN family toxin of toxin-antitoxin system [Variovorax sp. GrIS 2.14]|uniref:putative toxin-antitoxin system toxin component, PIN family n=1 Tax=Variovorax sp. GrIS 2.14 TaxID=3071709 RepID=UPI0038F61DCF